MCYLGLSVKGIRFRGEKLCGMQGPVAGFAGKRGFGPLIPLIIGVLGNIGLPTHTIDTNMKHLLF